MEIRNSERGSDTNKQYLEKKRKAGSVRLFVSLGLYTKMTTLGCLTIIKNKK